MRLWIGLLTLGLCAAASSTDLPRWQSETDLWSAAWVTSDTPRASVNLAALAWKRGDVETALLFDEDALTRANRYPEQAALVRTLVSHHITWALAFDHSADICARPEWQSFCS